MKQLLDNFIASLVWPKANLIEIKSVPCCKCSDSVTTFISETKFLQLCYDDEDEKESWRFWISKNGTGTELTINECNNDKSFDNSLTIPMCTLPTNVSLTDISYFQ